MNVVGKVCALLTVGIAATSVAPQAKAELRNPYVVEINIPQYFGDSQIVDGHYGLENYSATYVNGYLHIISLLLMTIAAMPGIRLPSSLQAKTHVWDMWVNDIQHQGTLSPNVNFFDPKTLRLIGTA